jgi:hypothetical protein
MLHDSLAELLADIVHHHRDVMVTFAVATSGGQQSYQMPVIKPLSLRKTKDGHFILTGYNLRRLPDDSGETISSKELIRSYRVDRIIPHTLQFLYPALPPQLHQAAHDAHHAAGDDEQTPTPTPPPATPSAKT